MRKPSDGLSLRGHGAALILVCAGVWLHAADSLLVATMLPALVAEIGGEALIGWTVSLYEIGTILTGAASGLLAARYGVRLPMAIAAAAFAAGCAISALAPSMWVVLAGRLLQGLGGGGLMALAFVATSVLFPRPLIPRAIAAVSALWGVSAFLGPLIGGLFVAYADWRGGFWFFAAQAVALSLWIGFGGNLGLGLGRQPLPDPARSTVFSSRLLLLAAGVVLIAYGGVEVGPLRTASCVLAGIAAIVAFLVLDARGGGSRLLPRRSFDPAAPVGSGLVTIFCLAIATIGVTAYGPLFIVLLHGASALVAGYIVACASIGWTIAALLVATSAERRDRTLIGAGMLVVAASIPGFLYSVPNGPVWLIAAFSALQGGGFGMAWAFVLRRMTALAPADDTERVAGALPTVQRLGYAVGAAYVGIVANAAGFAEGADGADRAGTAEAARAVFAAAIPFAVIGLAATARFVFPGAAARSSGRKYDADG